MDQQQKINEIVIRRRLNGNFNAGLAVAAYALLDENNEEIEFIVRRASVTLTDAQIRALVTTPVVIIPATETLNYDGFPMQIPLIVAATAKLDATAGAYTNISGGGASFLVLANGSDWSLTAAKSVFVGQGATDPALHNIALDNQARKSFYSFLPSFEPLYSDFLQDNAIAITANNTDGDFTGGNAANTMQVVIYYALISLDL